jgi:hypothetical protein
MSKNADRIILQDIARKAMISRGLEPDFPDAEISELKQAEICVISYGVRWIMRIH